MALIKCPECGRDISNTCTNCIHCGYPIEKPPKKISLMATKLKEKPNKKYMLVALTILIVIIIAYLCRGSLPFYYYNPTIIKILSLEDSTQVKSILGDDYTERNYDSYESWDAYNSQKIDGKIYDTIDLEYYGKEKKYHRIYIESNLSATFTKKDTTNMLKDLCKKYGTDYTLDDTSYSNSAHYEYEWSLGEEKRLLYEIYEDDEKEGKYYIKIIELFNELKLGGN